MPSRPTSIRIFGALMLVQGLTALATVPLTYAQEPGSLPMVLMAMYAIGYYLCFWFMIARRANAIALWFYVGLSLLDLPMTIVFWEEYTAPGTLHLALSLANLALELASVALLLCTDARTWVHARGQVPDHRDIFG
ncbi:hypothetical protein [Novosphingobium decolorationis]|uniref:Uncharacterized protein n=1 Tax=Novosphingobium decolorationis TaxID=2698673 RepID=A0ABX8E682_9SPHN|nr:hypothetical protein [Novosphingobium decolorationis]QVM84524.1 hypothetical protein HT578_13230 [Novosphingobium decolorationis]